MSSVSVPEEVGPVDPKGRRITLNCRVYVPMRQSSLVQGYMVPSFSGTVVRIEQDSFWGSHIISVRDRRNWNIRDVRPEDCRVQRGKLKSNDAKAPAKVVGKENRRSRRRRRKQKE